MAAFEKYLHDRIKIKGKTGQMATAAVIISRDRTKLTVASPAELNFSKRQLKYLSKRYLKKLQLKNFVRVVAASKMSYELRYYNISGENAGDDEE
jgi:large subunit ribosomal protein L22e